MFAHLPNALTAARLVVGVYFPFAPPDWWLWLLALAAASDLVDGGLARLLGATGDLGRYLDPVADKAVVLGALAALLGRGLVTPGELVLVALRDVMVVGGAVWMLAARPDLLGLLRPTRLGKLTTAAQVAYLLLLVWRREPPPPALTAAVGALSGLAGLDYLRRGSRGAALAGGTWDEEPADVAGAAADSDPVSGAPPRRARTGPRP
jgi:phosphatidylglycerophosphate synthase